MNPIGPALVDLNPTRDRRIGGGAAIALLASGADRGDRAEREAC
jgi:hypothetical protein